MFSWFHYYCARYDPLLFFTDDNVWRTDFGFSITYCIVCVVQINEDRIACVFCQESISYITRFVWQKMSFHIHSGGQALYSTNDDQYPGIILYPTCSVPRYYTVPIVFSTQILHGPHRIQYPHIIKFPSFSVPRYYTVPIVFSAQVLYSSHRVQCLGVKQHILSAG